MTMQDSRNLDVLRAFAVLCVLVAHVRQYVVHMPIQLYQMARFGVLMFFVHTCLVLLFSLERSRLGTREASLNFYIRRAFRIYPLSILTVLAVALLHIPREPDVLFEWIGAKQLVSNLTLTQNLTGALSLPAPLWSLPWEVQMYLVLPLLFFVFRKRSMWWGLGLWAAAVLGAHEPIHIAILKFSPCFLGGLIAYQALKGGMPRLFPAQLWPAALVAVSAFHAVCWRTHEQDLGGYVSCLMLGLSIPLFREMPASWFTRVGHTVAKYSYGIYLAHTPTIWFAFFRLAHAPAALRWSVFIALTAGLPVALYHLLEAPLINMGRRLAEGLRPRPVPFERVAQAAGGQ